MHYIYVVLSPSILTSGDPLQLLGPAHIDKCTHSVCFAHTFSFQTSFMRSAISNFAAKAGCSRDMCLRNAAFAWLITALHDPRETHGEKTVGSETGVSEGRQVRAGDRYLTRWAAHHLGGLNK